MFPFCNKLHIFFSLLYNVTLKNKKNNKKYVSSIKNCFIASFLFDFAAWLWLQEKLIKRSQELRLPGIVCQRNEEQKNNFPSWSMCHYIFKCP